MALHRKLDAMLRLRPDIAVICECAEAKRLQELTGSVEFGADAVSIGDNRNKRLAVLAFDSEESVYHGGDSVGHGFGPT